MIKKRILKPAQKRHFIYASLFIFFGCLLLVSCAKTKTIAFADRMNDFFEKKEVTIAITDSGLGGMSILAEAAEKMKTQHMFSRVQFVFFNALFSEEGGYNSLRTGEEKVAIFDSALKSLIENVNPDIILIGCNTLSTLYDKTAFSQQTQIPVVGIIQYGVDLISENLKSKPEAQVIVFGTQTTIEEGSHKKGLVQSGFLEERIITQSCPELVQYIEKDPHSEETEMLIFAYADEALQKLNSPETPLLVSLNCTHYGFSADLWESAFISLGRTPEAILNPNSRMIRSLFRPDLQDRVKTSRISIQVLSMVKIGDQERASIAQSLAVTSPQTADALLDYEYREDLFSWREFIFSERDGGAVSQKN